MSWSIKLENIQNIKDENIIDLSSLKDIELEILKTFAEFCDSNNLNYVLAGGTLLGAIRHQGFIPWDDDIDVLMPRPDYIKFLELTKGHMDIYTVRSIETHPKLHTRPFARVVDDRYITELKTLPLYLPPWIDIFPMDGLPSDNQECKKYFRKAYRYKWIIRRSWPPYNWKRKKLKTFGKMILFSPLRAIGHHFFLNKLQNFGMQMDYVSCEYVGCVVAGGHGIREKVLRSSFDERIKVKFEGYDFWAPQGYDFYLQNLYGKNYLALPGLKARAIHVINCWKIEGNVSDKNKEDHA